MDKFNEKFKRNKSCAMIFHPYSKMKKNDRKIAGWHKIMKRRLINVVNVHFFIVEGRE